ncbi:Abhydrolase domain-containing protein 4, partial [Stegodyphus mimosarum]
MIIRYISNIFKTTDLNIYKSRMETQTRGKFWRVFLTASSFSGLSYLFMFNNSFLRCITDWFRWCPTSPERLEEAERKIFSYLKTPHTLEFVHIAGDDHGKEYKIRSLRINNCTNEKSTPLVLLHGFASGIGLWILNLVSLSQDRPLYALDILGFGQSSRPSFSVDAEIAEIQMVESIEQWRKQIGLDHFILLGHSLGGFLAASYAIKYPEKVKHLILADPWGFPEPDLSVKKIEIPMWAKLIAFMLRPFNPLAGLRAAGPWGPQLIPKLRPDIIRKFDPLDPDVVSNYIYHCNAQTPSGESAFKAMTAHFGWAKRPMLKRISQLKQDIPITFIYGSRSWIDSSSGLQTSELRKNSYVEIKMIQGAGHHVYADRPDVFNKLVCDICTNHDSNLCKQLSSIIVNQWKLNEADNEYSDEEGCQSSEQQYN